MENVLEKVTLFSVIVTVTFTRGATRWNLKQVSGPPRGYPVRIFQTLRVRALFFPALPGKGNPTRVFASYEVSGNATATRVPAIVLIHSGGGTAFADWIRLWTARGYASIALDACGSMPINPDSHQLPPHQFGGPPCWDASFDQIGWAVKDQWTYHAVAEIEPADSLLRCFPETGSKCIGITGISWGRLFRLYRRQRRSEVSLRGPVYGCGFLGEDSLWVPKLQKLGSEKEEMDGDSKRGLSAAAVKKLETSLDLLRCSWARSIAADSQPAVRSKGSIRAR